ncbi:hypothetical protein [Bacteroides sp. GM023]|uniref:hypothetical protein n=1 Tax=Bacteroides sp. GM023 TaxID=2723058 RepID=UPI00168A9F97|nr:hypothetical protein [Bacteroides sp. GM023]MBD3592257.1 hypothetical protein [Bacteroides sp. GM023]
MRKWTYLVAALLMAGTTATFTGCIDTDEPEGITNLRGAKSELIKAQAAVELVEVEMQKAKVANQELLNKAQELANQKAEYDNQLQALEVKLKELKVELEQATNEAEKARIEAEIAESNKRKADAENNMALAAEKFKEDMLAAQEATARAQASYDIAMEEIELAKLTLSDKEQRQVQAAQEFLASATSTMNGKYNALKNAQTAYFNALTDPKMPTLGQLEAQLAEAQVDVEKAEISLQKNTEILAFVESKDFGAAEWDVKKADYKKQIDQYKSEQQKAELKKQEKLNSPEYKKAEKLEGEKATLETETKTAYDVAHNDSIYAMAGTAIRGTVTTLSIKKYESEPINKELITLFGKVNPFASAVGGRYDTAKGQFIYNGGTYSQENYLADLAMEDSLQATTAAAAKSLYAVDSWIKALGDEYSIDDNGTEWSKIALEKAKKVLKAKEADLDDLKADWNIIVKAYKDGEITAVPQKGKTSQGTDWDLKKSVDTYNTNYDALDAAIKAFNTDYKTKYDAAYNTSIDKWKADEKKNVEFELMWAVIDAKDNLRTAYNSFVGASPTIDQKISTAKLVLTNLNSGVGIPGEGAISDEVTKNYTANKATIESNASIAALAAVKSLKDDKITAANIKVQSTLSPLDIAISSFKVLASYPYTQIVVNNLSISDLTNNTSGFYKKETDATTQKITYKILGKKISVDGKDNDYGKLTETKLKDDTAMENDLTKASYYAFGNIIPTTGESARLTEVTEDMVRSYYKEHPNTKLENNGSYGDYGQLGVVVAAKDKVDYYTNLSDVEPLLTALNKQLKDVRTKLQAEIQANSVKIQEYVDKANEARIAYYKAVAEKKQATEDKEALTKEVEAEIQKCKDLVIDIEALVGVVDTQIENIGKVGTTGAAVGESVAEIINYWKAEVAGAATDVEDAKQVVKVKKTEKDLFIAGDYTLAYVTKNAKMALDSAQAEYDKSQSVYKMAFAQLEALLAALTK